MAVTETKLLGINQAAITKIVSDTSTATTLDTNVFVIPGAQSLKLSPKFVQKDLMGDEQILDTYSKLQSFDFTWTNGLMSLDNLALLMGGTVASGTGSQTLTMLGNTIPDFFQLEAVVNYNSGSGDVHFTLFKCKANKVDYELKGQDYASVSVTGTAIPTVFNKKLHAISINDTATPIAVTDAVTTI